MVVHFGCGLIHTTWKSHHDSTHRFHGIDSSSIQIIHGSIRAVHGSSCYPCHFIHDRFPHINANSKSKLVYTVQEMNEKKAIEDIEDAETGRMLKS